MQRLSPIVLLFIWMAFSACSDSTSNPQGEDSQDEITEAVENIDVDQMMVNINKERLAIESEMEQMEKRVVSSTNLLPVIAKNWEKVEFLSDDSGLRRVKTLPYPESSQTQEFYYTNGDLRCAVVEAMGSEQAASESMEGSVYYYHSGEVIREMETNAEERIGNNADAERLLQEASYFLQLDSLIHTGKTP